MCSSDLVVGIASQKYGEEVGAFIVLQPDSEVDEEDVRDFCQDKIARYKIPKYVFFVDDYPLTASGKTQKYLLREMGLKKVQDLGIST